jgi:hypothetical protein
MIKIVFLSILCLLLASCHQTSSYVSRYGQSIVLNPQQSESNTENNLTSLIKQKSNPKKQSPIITSKIESNINFSSTKFLKGNADCIQIIRVKIGGSLTYDELMNALIKRANTLGGNAVGISDLNEKKETILTHNKVAQKNNDKVINNLIKETNMLSSVTADIFKCNSQI